MPATQGSKAGTPVAQSLTEQVVTRAIDALVSPCTTSSSRQASLSRLGVMIRTLKMAEAESATIKGGERRDIKGKGRAKDAQEDVQGVWDQLQDAPHTNVAQALVSHIRCLLAMLSGAAGLKDGAKRDFVPPKTLPEDTVEELSMCFRLLPGLCLSHTGSKKLCAQRGVIDLFLSLLRLIVTVIAADRRNKASRGAIPGSGSEPIWSGVDKQLLELLTLIAGALTAALIDDEQAAETFEQRGGLDTLKDMMAISSSKASNDAFGRSLASSSASSDGRTASGSSESTQKASQSGGKAGGASSSNGGDALHWACLELLTALYRPEEFEAISKRESPRKRARQDRQGTASSNGSSRRGASSREGSREKSKTPQSEGVPEIKVHDIVDPSPLLYASPERVKLRKVPSTSSLAEKEPEAKASGPRYLRREEQQRSRSIPQLRQVQDTAIDAASAPAPSLRHARSSSALRAKPLTRVAELAGEERPRLRHARSSSALRTRHTASDAIEPEKKGSAGGAKRSGYAALGLGGGRATQSAEPTEFLPLRRSPRLSDEGTRAVTPTLRDFSTTAARQDTVTAAPPVFSTGAGDFASKHVPMSPAVKRAQAARSLPSSQTKQRLDSLLSSRFDAEVTHGTHPPPRRREFSSSSSRRQRA